MHLSNWTYVSWEIVWQIMVVCVCTMNFCKLSTYCESGIRKNLDKQTFITWSKYNLMAHL
jgi:hypothetical protein